MRDLAEEDPLEVEASRSGLNYIKLDGSVGSWSTAHLAMATMDLVARRGRARELPGRRRGRQRAGQERLPHHPSDKNVRAILINIFGGIMRCDIVARESWPCRS
jgi:succinyl-CoA synthetase beta subunit